MSNCGRVAASRVRVNDYLAKGATFGARGHGTLAGHRLHWTTSPLAPGARRIFRITTRLNRGARTGRYVNRVTAGGGNAPRVTARGATVVIP